MCGGRTSNTATPRRRSSGRTAVSHADRPALLALYAAIPAVG